MEVAYLGEHGETQTTASTMAVAYMGERGTQTAAGYLPWHRHVGGTYGKVAAQKGVCYCMLGPPVLPQSTAG